MWLVIPAKRPHNLKKCQPFFFCTQHLFSFNAHTGGFQHCGDVLWREYQDNSSVCVLPRVCALHQSLQSTFSFISHTQCLYLYRTYH